MPFKADTNKTKAVINMPDVSKKDWKLSRKRLSKELQQEMAEKIQIEALNDRFSVCKVKDYSMVDLKQAFCF